ncbi:MAG: DNA recombination protein RmuC [Candidatus Verstraetearchaeota archaeon]|nr:DNA recombination protein RmuC [Candidatus Verstraetearchaeota archaeon]
MIEYAIVVLVLAFAILIFFVNKHSSQLAKLNQKIDQIEENLPQTVEFSVMKTIQNSSGIFQNAVTSALSQNTDIIKGAFATSLKELGIQEDLGAIKNAAGDLKNVTSDLKSMFEVTTTRGRFGELQLESILGDIFPPQKFRIRESIGTEVPDAYIIIDENKYLCIDSKFPLDNFKRYLEAEDPGKKERYWKDFLRNVGAHVGEIKNKYVGKENTMDFAFMFIPSDRVYYTLVSEAPEFVSDAAKSGVIMTSPSLLPAHLSLVLTKIQAEEISKRANEVQRKIQHLGTHIENLERTLNILFRHVRNSSNKIPDVERALDDLKLYYNSLSRFELEES